MSSLSYYWDWKQSLLFISAAKHRNPASNSNNFIFSSVLIFPPVSSYRRFLIHKVCETITANQPRALATFSIGLGDQRRTVICHRYQLLVDLSSVSLKRFVFDWQIFANYHIFHCLRNFKVIFCSAISELFNFHYRSSITLRRSRKSSFTHSRVPFSPLQIRGSRFFFELLEPQLGAEDDQQPSAPAWYGSWEDRRRQMWVGARE